MWTALILGLVDFVLTVKYVKVDDCDIEHCRHICPGSGFMAMLKYNNEKSFKKKYEKPEYELVKNMSFMFDSLKKKEYACGCRQCSSCHGCR